MGRHKITNDANGPRGFYADSGLVMLEPGETREAEVSDAEVKSAKAVGLSFKSGKADDGLDYERDDLGKADLHKPATSKDVLLVIAAYEQADVPEGDDATKADLIKAIEAKRKAKS